MSQRILGFDFESSGKDVASDHPLLLGIGDHVILCPKVDLRLLAPVMTSTSIVKIAHNAAFDGGWFQKIGVYPRRIVDTMIGEMVLNCGLIRPAGYFSLGQTLLRRLGVAHDKGLQLSFVGADPETFEPTEEQIKYLLRDVRFLPSLAGVLAEEINQAGLKKTWQLENRFTQTIAMMALHGAPVDLENYRAVLAESEEEYNRLAEVLSEALTPSIMEVRRREYDEDKAIWDEWAARRDMAFATIRVGIYGDREKGNKEELASFNAGKKGWREANPAPFTSEPRLVSSPIKPTSSRQLKAALNELGVDVADTERVTLLMAQPLATPEQRTILETMGKFSEVKRFREGYGTLLLSRMHPDGRVRTRYHQIKTTGRIGSSKWSDKARCEHCGGVNPFDDEDDTKPKCDHCGKEYKGAEFGTNLQNPHKKFRKHVVAPAGRLFTIADYSQVELRVAAEYILRFNPESKDALVAAFRDGEDPHSRMAARVSGRTYADILSAVDSGDEPTVDLRKAAKTTNFSTLFGITPPRLAAKIYVARADTRPFGEVQIAEAADLIAAFRELNPTIGRIQDQWGEMALELGYTETLGGRRRYFTRTAMMSRAQERAIRREASNAPIQGTAADIAKEAGVLIYDSLAEFNETFPEYDAFLWNAVHDEVCSEHDEELEEVMNPKVKELCLQAYNKYILHVPGDVECKTGKVWKH